MPDDGSGGVAQSYMKFLNFVWGVVEGPGKIVKGETF